MAFMPHSQITTAMDKALKVIWLINGILLLIVLVILLAQYYAL